MTTRGSLRALPPPLPDPVERVSAGRIAGILSVCGSGGSLAMVAVPGEIVRLPLLVVLVALTGLAAGSMALLRTDWAATSGWAIIGSTAGGTCLVVVLGVAHAPIGAPAVTVAVAIGVYAACVFPSWLGRAHGLALTAALVVPALVAPLHRPGTGLPALLVAAPLLIAIGVIVSVTRLRLSLAAKVARAVAAEHRALHRVADASISGKDVFAVAALEIADVLGVDGAAILRLEAQTAVVLGAWDRRPSPVHAGFEIPLTEGGLLEPLAVHGHCIHIDAHDPDAGGFVERLGYRTLGAVPITLGQQRWGAVVVSTVEEGGLPRDAIERLSTFAGLLALSLIDADSRRRLSREATTDPLTGLTNRREFDRELAAAVTRAHDEGTELVLALLDVDNFKAVNDRYGHPGGDRVLVQFAAALTSGLREGDIAARIGGDEFALVLQGADVATAVAVLQRLQATLRAAGGDPVVRCSGGVCRLAETWGPATLVVRADEALYATKQRGRDGVTVFPPGPDGPWTAADSAGLLEARSEVEGAI